MVTVAVLCCLLHRRHCLSPRLRCFTQCVHVDPCIGVNCCSLLLPGCVGAQMRAHQGGVLGTQAVTYMQQLLCDPHKQQGQPTLSKAKAQLVVPLSPSLSAIKSAYVVTRTDSGNVDI